MQAKLRGVLVAGLLALSGAASAAIISITPNTDPGNLTVGDTLTFTLSVDSIAPPSGKTWAVAIPLGMGLRISGPDNFNFSGCSDLSGLSPVTVSCTSGGFSLNLGSWIWNNGAAGLTQTISGNLVSFTALFDQAGTYQVFLDGASASFESPFERQQLTLSFTRENPIIINVAGVADVPAPATLALLGLGLVGLGFSRRKK